MSLKFHTQHDQTAGLQTCKSQPGRESKMAVHTKDSKTIKITFISEIGGNFVCIISGTLVLSDSKMKQDLSQGQDSLPDSTSH